MGFIKGLTNFILMMSLVVLLMLTLMYGILNDSILSFKANIEMLETTKFSEEVSDVISVKYQTKLESVSLDHQHLLEFVQASSTGIAGYVFSEIDELPEVDVAFLKTYVEEEVARKLSESLIENLDLDELIRVVKEVPEGESIGKAVTSFAEESGFNISNSDTDAATKIFIENKALEAEALKVKLIEALSLEKVDTSQMKDSLSLQQFFDQLMSKNPFTLARQGFEVVDKNLGFYLPVMILLIILLMAIVEFKLSNSITWFILALLVAIMPLQVLRVVNYLIKKDWMTAFDDYSSYVDFMMSAMIKSLNIYTLIVTIMIVLLFVLKRTLKNRVDDKVEDFISKNKKMWMTVRISSFILVLIMSSFVISHLISYNVEYKNSLQEIQPADFDPIDLDDVLSDGLNIKYDF